MRFEFDTSTDGIVEIDAALAFFTALSSATPFSRAPQATVGDNGASGTTAPPSPSDATGESTATTGEPTDQVEGSPAFVKPARVRRTKAQIEADNLAAEKAFADKQIPIQLTQAQQDAVDDTAGILTTEQKSAIQGAVDGTADADVKITADQVAKIVDLDALRTALQTYTAKHDLAAGIALLGTFECKRISDVLNIPAEKQQAFLLACNV